MVIICVFKAISIALNRLLSVHNIVIRFCTAAQTETSTGILTHDFWAQLMLPLSRKFSQFSALISHSHSDPKQSFNQCAHERKKILALVFIFINKSGRWCAALDICAFCDNFLHFSAHYFSWMCFLS